MPLITTPTLILPAELRAVRPSALLGTQLSRDDIIAVAEAAKHADCYLDLRDHAFDAIDLSRRENEPERRWERLIFGLNDQLPVASLVGCDFRRTTLLACLFVRVRFREVNFTECVLENCDLRFTRLRGARLGSARFVSCDFYGASLDAGTVATNMRFELSTFPQFGDRITGLSWSCVENQNGAPAFAGERVVAYRRLLKRTEKERPDPEGTVAEAIDDRLSTAKGAYRRLSVYWASQGRFEAANRAYARSRRLERQAASPWYAIARRIWEEGTFGEPRDQRQRRPLAMKWRSRTLQPTKWLSLWIADVTSCFGQSLTRVSATLAAVAVLPALAYARFHSIHGARSVWDDLLFSVARLTAYSPSGLSPAGKAVEWAGVIQSAVGIGLIGLFGYVLGNVLRQS